MRARWGFWFLSGFLVLVVDQLSKALVDHFLLLNERVAFFGQKALMLGRTHNLGLMNGKYSGIPRGYIETYTHYIPTAILVAFALLAGAGLRRAGALERLGYTLILSGGASNLISQYSAGFVTDTLAVHIGNGWYNHLNVADIALTTGLALFVWGTFSHSSSLSR